MRDALHDLVIGPHRQTEPSLILRNDEPEKSQLYQAVEHLSWIERFAIEPLRVDMPRGKIGAP